MVQGFGITEDGTAPDNVLEANVTIISNSKCTSEMDKMSKLYENEIIQALPNGLSDKVLCTQGIWNKKKSVFTVSFINIYLTTCLGFLIIICLIDAVTSSEILKVNQKLGVTFNFDKQDVIDLTKFSKMTMCRASEANSEK